MRKFVVFICALTASAVLRAQSVPSLLVPADAAAVVASTVLFSEGRAFESNAAAAALSPSKYSAWAGVSSWAPATAGTFIAGGGASVRLGGKFALGASFKSFKDKPYDIVSASGSVSGSFAPSDQLISIGASYGLLPGLGAGLVLRMVSSAIAPSMKGSAFCADLTAYYSKGALSAGAGIYNIGSKIDWGGDSYSLPAVVKAGAAYSVAGLKAGAEAEYLLDGAFGASFGAEYLIAGIVPVRAGYHYGNKEKGLASYASLGLGARIAGVSLDLSYLLASQTLGGSILVALSYSF